jgi:hypothetical protein
MEWILARRNQMVFNLRPSHEQCLLHTERELYLLIPFFSKVKPTALYYMDKLRYGKYFEEKRPQSRSTVYTNWHKVKWELQNEYQRELEAQGKVLRDIFLKREATENSTAVDYLLWINFQWDLYVKNLYRGEFKFDNFIDFVHSELSRVEELTESDCYGKRDQISQDHAPALEPGSAE